MPEPAAQLSVSLWRGGADGRYETYSVPRRESQTVLDVVTYVQRHIDPTLSYRFACRVGMCGSCAMTVNGHPRWTCRTHVAKVADGGRLRSARSRTCRSSRIWRPTWRRFSKNGSRRKACSRRRRLAPNRWRGSGRTARARIAADAAIECINCGVCYAACDTVRWNSGYLGPAALNRAWTLVNDVRDPATGRVLPPSRSRAAAIPATRTNPARSTARSRSIRPPRSPASSAAAPRRI